MIRHVEEERDKKLAALDRQREAIVEAYSRSIDGVHSELQRTVEFLQARFAFLVNARVERERTGVSVLTYPVMMIMMAGT